MPRPKRNPVVNRYKGGRPVKKIDWHLVDKLVMAGANGPQIAPFFDMHPQTFYDRVVLEKGVGFTEYSCGKREYGNALLLTSQFDLAVKEKDMMSM